uniref:Uncharacterized protein n=1 Tax=Arundo donax TaxID=35708 RepID=A0A0A8YZV7_ARUDO
MQPLTLRCSLLSSRHAGMQAAVCCELAASAAAARGRRHERLAGCWAVLG